MAILVDIKSKLPTPLVVNLQRHHFGLVPGLQGTIMKRTLHERDPASGEIRPKVKTVHCPPAITIPARGVVKGLPVAVLQNPVIKGMLIRANGRRPKLLVIRQYDPDADKPMVTAKAVKSRPTKGKRNKAATSK